MALNNTLRVANSSELLSYVINSNPELSANIDLPVQGESIIPIGKMIVSNQRYKNAFLNTINVIALTVISRNYFKNPWEEFTEKGSISFGQTVRELAVDIADVEDYNYYVNNATHFLDQVVPNIYNYLHELNFQKFYKTTTSDEQLAMAFTTEAGLMDLVEEIVNSLYKGYEYDKFLVNKYMLARRIVDGTIPAVEIDGYGSLTARQRVAAIKSVSNKMAFMSPNYNPAGLRRATAFEDQYLIVDANTEAEYTTEVLATSYFRNDAEYRTNLALVDDWTNWDDARLSEILGDAYTKFTDAEVTALGNIAGVIISREFFKNYTYALDNAMEGDATRTTMFFNPESLKANHFLHAWKVFSTSPFEQCAVFLKDVTPAVSAVSVSPESASVYAGNTLQMSATVTTTGFANKSVTWKAVDSSTGLAIDGVSIGVDGLLKVGASVPNETSIKVIATSVFDSSKSDYGTITVINAVAPTPTPTPTPTEPTEPTEVPTPTE